MRKTNREKESPGANTPRTRLGNQAVAARSAKTMQDYVDAALSGKTDVPVYHGRINKREICRRLDIGYSTIGSNPSLKDQFDRLQDGIARRPTTDLPAGTASPGTARSRAVAADDDDRHAADEERIAELEHRLRQHELAESHMIRHGRQLDAYRPRDGMKGDGDGD